jgi:hypothetical protein
MPADEVAVVVPPVAAAAVVEAPVFPPVLPLIALEVLLAAEVPPVAELPPALVFTAVDPPELDGAVVPPLSQATARSMEEPSTTMPSPVIRFSAIIRNLPRK